MVDFLTALDGRKIRMCHVVIRIRTQNKIYV